MQSSLMCSHLLKFAYVSVLSAFFVYGIPFHASLLLYYFIKHK